MCLLVCATTLAGCQAESARSLGSLAGTWVGGTSCHGERLGRYGDFDLTVVVSEEGLAYGTVVKRLASSRPEYHFRGRVEKGVLTTRLATRGATVHRVELVFPPHGHRAEGRFGASTWCPLILERS